MLLKEQTLDSHHHKSKKKKKSKTDKIGSPRNFEHFVAVRRGDHGLKVRGKENSILPISNRPFVNSDSDGPDSSSHHHHHHQTIHTSNTATNKSGIFRRFRRAKVRRSSMVVKFKLNGVEIFTLKHS